MRGFFITFVKTKIMNKGFIKISDVLYRNEWEMVSVLFKYFRPAHIKFKHWENDVWVLYGESELFEELKEGEKVPEYDAIFTTKDGIASSIEFKRVKP